MTAPDPVTTAAPAQEPTAAPPAPASTPPWGAEENFDAGRAWSLIENLRAEKDKLAARPALSTEQQQQLTEYERLVEASKSEAQRQQEAVETARRDAETARAEAIRYKAAATYGIPSEHFDLLGSGSEEEITARADKIRTLIAAQAAAQVPPPAAAPAGRSVEQLRPGASPAGVTSEDDAIYARLFGAPT